MESLFRFTLNRPPTALADDETIPLERKTTFFADLSQARAKSPPLANMKAVAQKMVVTERFVRSLAGLHFGAGLSGLRADLATRDTSTGLAARITELFGKSVGDLAGDADLRHDAERLADSVLAIKVLSSEQGARLTELTDGLRMIALIKRLAQGDATLDQPGALKRAMQQALRLPPSLFPIVDNAAKKDAAARAPRAARELTEARTRLTQVRVALDELSSLDASALAHATFTPPQVTDREDSATHPMTTAHAADAAESPLTVKRANLSRLSEGTRATLSSLQLDPQTLPIDRILPAMHQQLALVARRAALLDSAQLAPPRVGMISSTPVLVTATGSGAVALSGGAPPGALPSSHGTIRAVGVADLLVVKQNLKRYETRDIAHVENVLSGESKKREHNVTETVEQTSLIERETTRTTERDTQTTDRFEMNRAASETIQQDASLQTGLTVSGSYGPSVDFETNINGAVSESRQRSTETASSYSHDVTERSRTLVSERVLDQRTFKQSTVVEEKNSHGIDNTGQSAPVVGIYQWLEKIYEAQIFSYGLRTMFDFVVPEPAAFAIYAMQSGFADATQVEKPKDFTLTPLDISESSYPGYVRDWQATGVAPPPEPFITLSKTFRGGPDAHDAEVRGMTVDAVELPILEGYQALNAHVVARWGRWDPDTDMSIKVSVGGSTQNFVSGGNVFVSSGLDGEVGSIPVTVRTYRVSSFTVGIEVKCQRTARAMEKWRNETHSALLQAYQQRLAVYEEKLKALQSKAGVEISGRDPAQNREIEMRELKRACIEILTAQHFELFGAISTPTDAIPEPDVAETGLEGPYIRFFEQAFEWQNATYVFYPYFWGRRSTWADRYHYDDADPLFGHFLRAGAARVVVPVRPGFELDIDHFMNTGEIWNGGELPPISSPDYVPIVAELSEQLGAPGDEVPVGDSWEVSVPTSLTLLRTDGTLPRWRKDDQGNWVSDDS